MHPSRVDRNHLHSLTDLPNIGKAGAADLRLLGIQRPSELAGRCPFAMYTQLCELTGVRHDPCVIDVFMSVTHFVDGGEARNWWSFTEERKLVLRQRAALGLSATAEPSSMQCGIQVVIDAPAD